MLPAPTVETAMSRWRVRDLRCPGRLRWGTIRLLMHTVTSSPPRPEATGERRRLRVLVGVHDGTLSGVNTYVEHVAAAAATAVEEVTLLVADDGLAAEVGLRLEGTGIRIVSLGMDPITPRQRRLERLSPGYAARRLDAALTAVLPKVGGGFDAAHLNHPHLAATVRPVARRVFVAAWFYPHSLTGRVSSTWRHSGRRFPRSAGLALKGVLHHLNDVRGYRTADVIVAPTRVLTDQLCAAGLDAVQSAPPAGIVGGLPEFEELARRPAGPAPRLVVCSGDLGHPRKNVGLAMDAVALLGANGTRIEVELIGGNAQALSDRIGRLPGTIRVTTSGRLPVSEVHRRMRDADLLLFPSLFEEWGYVAAESALQGVPVVTLPVYPFEEMLEPPLGHRSAGLGAAQYADAIGTALRTPARRSVVSALAEERFGLAGAGRRLAAIWARERPPTASEIG